ncbi:MAG: hypothetical protein JWM27_3281 [Gemmatimonadetes bacterium]|nr:hypothetical protein [Gemmatimonadota bacterium]
MKTAYDRFEVGVAVAGALAAAGLAVAAPGRLVVGMPDLLRWGGVFLLVQGFFRDVVILVRRRREARNPAMPSGFLICVESTLGLVLIGVAWLLAWAGGDRALALPPAAWLALAAAWWAFGYATREMVLELRRDPDHMNLLIGRPRRGVR